jgi:predicted PhzF superfamily epimerase YddE/YHI9
MLEADMDTPSFVRDLGRKHRLLSVFTGPDGTHGNTLAVFLEGSRFRDDERQAIANHLGYSETVFVEDMATGRVRIFTPRTELRFAGHPLVGVGWLIAHELGVCEILRPPAGEVQTWADGDLRWISARHEWARSLALRAYGSAAEVDALGEAPDGLGFVYCWAWADEAAGIVRARSFVPDQGIREDEATGVAALRLGGELGRNLEIRQGKGSRIYVRQASDGMIEIGGRVTEGG